MPGHLHSLRISWNEFYEVAACVMPSDRECWTGVRVDGSGVLTAPDWVTLALLLREDHGSYPQARAGPRPDWQLGEVRRKHPGFAVIAVPGGWRAFRGGATWPGGDVPCRHLSVLGNLLCAQGAEDARAAAAIRLA